MADMIRTAADAAGLIRDGVNLLDSVALVEMGGTATDVAAEFGTIMAVRRTADLIVVSHGGAVLKVTVELLTPDDQSSDASTIATAAGWLIEPVDGDDFDEGVMTASAAAGSYTLGDWQRDLTPPFGSVYQWRIGSKGEGIGLFLSNGTTMANGTQYRLATITGAEG